MRDINFLNSLRTHAPNSSGGKHQWVGQVPLGRNCLVIAHQVEFWFPAQETRTNPKDQLVVCGDNTTHLFRTVI